MKLSEIMRKVPLLRPEATVRQAAAVFRAANADFLPVVDEGLAFIGALSGKTLLAAVDSRLPEESIRPYVSGAFPCLPADQALREIPDNVSQAVLIDGGNRVIGIVTSEDLIKAMCFHMQTYEERTSAAINSAQNGILAIDNNGIITIANQTVATMLGIPSDRIIGRYVAEVIPNTLMLNVLSGKQPLYGQRLIFGATPIMANYSLILKNGGVTGVVCIFQDLSSIEKVSSELSTVKGLMTELEAIICSSYDGIFITDGNGEVLRLNEAYERITGIRAGEVVGKTMKQLVEEGVYDQSVTMLVLEKRESVTIDQTVKAQNKHILVTGNPIFDENGNIFRVVTNVRDVTQLSRLQDQLTKSKEQTLKYRAELSHLRSMQLREADIIYRSKAMAAVVELAVKIADVDSTVLISGESGTGKEVIAKLIHRQGMNGKPFIKINCGAIPEQLLESELFGYEGGAFTGARKEGKPGLFELANNGTLFLDEVGELPHVLQVKLLRVIQEKEVVRVGGAQPIRVNVRIIAATNRDLAKMVASGTFREDLYYRLMVVPVQLPPVRERKEDIPLLVMFFIDKLNARFGYNKKISSQAVDKLMEYSWPGNVRELENVIERMMVVAPGDELTVDILPESICRKVVLPKRGARLKEAVAQTEAYLLAETYREWGSWQKVAEILGVDRTTVFRKAAKYKLLT